MAVSINSLTFVITIPQADLTFLSGANYQLNTWLLHIWLRDWEDNEGGIYHLKTHNHNTEVTLGGIQYARIVEILSPYTITFQSTGTPYKVFLVGANNNVLDVTNLNDVSVSANNSGGLIGLSDIRANAETSKRLIEGLRPHHKGYGDLWYWDPLNGSNTNDGLTPTTACLTFAYIHDNLVSDWGHDIVLISSLNATSAVIITETLNITKNWVFVRGAGFNTKFNPTTVPASKAVITINSEGVQLAGFHVDLINCTDPDSIGIKKTGKYFHMQNVIVKRAAKQGLISINGHDEVIEDCMIGYNGTDGIEITNSGVGSKVEDILVKNCHLDENGANGINITGTTVHEALINGNTQLHKNTQYGLKIGTGAEETHIFPDVIFRGNVLGRINDAGTNTTRSAVWDVTIADHLTAGTTGKALSDAGSAGNPWSSPITGNTTAGTFGELVGKKLLTVAKFLGLK